MQLARTDSNETALEPKQTRASPATFMFHYQLSAASDGAVAACGLRLSGNILKSFETRCWFNPKLKHSENIWIFLVESMKLQAVQWLSIPSDELDLARLRALARKKPRTKAGQVRQAWPEIRDLLAAGHTLKDVCAWVNEIGIVIGYARLSDYVNQLRRAQPDPRDLPNAAATAAPASLPTTADAAITAKAEQTPSKHDPLANVRRSESNRPGFHYRAAVPADEKDLI